MPRKANPDTPTPAQRSAAYRRAHRLSKVELTVPSQEDAAAILARDGDPSVRAVVARALRVLRGGDGRAGNDEGGEDGE